MKKSILALSLLAVTTLASCNPGTPSTTSEGGKTDTNSTAGEAKKTLNVMCWNNEFEQRFESYYPGVTKVSADNYKLSDGTPVRFIIEPNDGNNYQNKLDARLKANESAAADDKIDMFLIEADYATKYTKSSYTLDLKADIGLTDADLGDQYKYTQDIVTVDGKLKATSWQATPGLFAYRRDLAKSVLGTDNPTEVQAKLADWDKFNAVAAQMKAADVKMLSGYADNFRPYSNNMATPWVDANKKVVLDPMIKKWIVNTKDYADKKYIDDVSLWSAQWQADQGPDGSKVESKDDNGNKVKVTAKKTFGFFYSTWGINFTLAGNADPNGLKVVKNSDGTIDTTKSLYGDYAVCEGPATYYWGGSWLCAAKGTDQKDVVKDIMKKLTCDASIAEAITRGTQDYTNNKTAMHKLATDKTYGSEFLGGQNHIALFEKNAEKISMKNAGPYDQTLNEGIQNSFEGYFFGKIDYVTALKNYKDYVNSKVNGLTFDSAWDNWDGTSI